MVKHISAVALAASTSFIGAASAFTHTSRDVIASLTLDCSPMERQSRASTALFGVRSFLKSRFSLKEEDEVSGVRPEANMVAVARDNKHQENPIESSKEAKAEVVSTELPFFDSVFSFGGEAKFTDAVVEATFFSLDADSSGAIDREEFADALIDLGVDLSNADADNVFKKYAIDGEIDLDNFKLLLQDDTFEGITPTRCSVCHGVV